MFVFEKITHENRATLESMCYSALCSLNVDDICDLFESLASYQWQYEFASESFACPSPPPYDLHAQSPSVDQIRDACDHYSSYPLDLCFYCQSFDHDVNSCPYYDVSDESCVRLNAMIETMNERQEDIISEMRECSVYCMRPTLVYLSLGLTLASMMIMSLPFPYSLILLMMHL